MHRKFARLRNRATFIHLYSTCRPYNYILRNCSEQTGNALPRESWRDADNCQRYIHPSWFLNHPSGRFSNDNGKRSLSTFEYRTDEISLSPVSSTRQIRLTMFYELRASIFVKYRHRLYSLSFSSPRPIHTRRRASSSSYK